MIYTGKGILKGKLKGKALVIESGSEIPGGSVGQSQLDNLKKKGWISDTSPVEAKAKIESKVKANAESPKTIFGKDKK